MTSKSKMQRVGVGSPVNDATEVVVPNAETLAAMEEAELLIHQKSKRFITGEDLINNLEQDS